VNSRFKRESGQLSGFSENFDEYREPRALTTRLIVDKFVHITQGVSVIRLTRLVLKVVLPILLTLASLNPIGASAVTYGNPVSDPLTTAPYVVSIWKDDKGDAQKAEFLCSGTLISSNIVLTAAHCTDFPKTSFFVKTGAVALKQELPLYPATPWTGTRYDPKSISGDFGLLRLNTKITGIAFPSLANSVIAKQINTKTSFTLMGWGEDQNGKLTDTLRFSKLRLQDSASKRSWGKYFNSKTMISAGKFIKNEDKWSGSCRGDSGGPLLSKLGEITYVVGITSWGANDCRIEKPSVFTRVSYFEKDIRAGIKAVELLASTVNRLAPVELVTPTMQGGTTPGSSMTCNIGKWENVVNVSYEWISPARMVGITSVETKIISADAGQEFKCRIIAKSKSGDYEASVVRTASKKLVKTLSVASPPVIGGLQNSDIVQPGTVARCEGWNWAEPVDSELIEWFTTALGNPTTPVNGKLIGSGKQITLTEEILKSERGRHLVCQLTGIRDGFPSYLVASKFMAAPNAPVISDVVVRSSSLKSGSQATCTYSASPSGTSVSYDWGYTGAGNTFTPFGGQNADFIQISSQVLKSASGQKLACKVTVTNQGISTSRVGTSYDIFESALESPKVTLSLPSSFYSGASASCSIPYNSKYTATTYEWGISNSLQSSAFTTGVLSRSSSFSFDSDTLIRSAGNFLTCVVNVENEIGKAQGFASAQVSQNAAPALPTPGAPSISKQTKENSSVAVAISIPSVYEYNPATMEITLVMQGTNCDGNRINSLPTTLNCSGLLGSTSYSATLSIRYLSNGQITPKQSQRLQFTTIDATSAPSISISNATQTVVSNTAIANVVVNNSGGTVNASGYTVSPGLPTGLILNSNTGTISGTPTTSQSQRSYTLTATGLGGTSTSIFTLTVTAAETSPSISISNSNQSVTVNTQILSIVPTNTGGTVSSGGYSVSPSLPAGLTLNSNTGVISGTPVNTQTQRTYTMTASGPAGSSNVTFVITVTTPEAAPSISISNSVQSITAGTQIISTAISNSGGAIASGGFTVSPSLPSGLSLNSSTGVISGTPLFAQSQRIYSVTATGSGGSSTATFTLTVVASVIDIASPVIATSGATLSVNEITAGSGVTVTFRATDDIGITSTTVAIANSSNSIIAQIVASLISGSVSDGIYRATIAIPSGTAVGNYKLIAKGSDASNKNSVGNSGISQYVLLGNVSVVLPRDEQAPSISASTVQISPSLINENGSITIVVPLQDNVAVTGVQVNIYRSADYPTSPAQNTATSFNLARVSGTAQSGNWSGSQGMNIRYGQSDGYLGEGYYNVTIKAFDGAGNISEITIPNGFVLSKQTSGPYISNTTTLPLTTPLRAGGSFKIQTRLFAYGHKIKSAEVRSDGYNMNFNLPLTRISGTSDDGIYEATIVLASNQAPGTFVYWIEAGTDNGRAAERIEVPVVIAGPDLTAPTVVSYSGTLSSPSITGQIVSVPNVGNVSDGMATNSDFTVTFQITDNTAVASAILCVDTSSEDRLTGIILNISGVGSYGVNDGRCVPASLISGNAASGTYSASGRFPPVASLAAMSLGACGRYTVRAQALDQNGNRSTMATVRKIDIVTCRS
jgi:secreted trypsin-like serine protease